MQTRGFTLIELMVSVAIFAIVMVIALGALLSISTADRKAETVSSVMNNLNAAVESMTRNIRTGYDYHCGSTSGGDCTYPGDDFFKFTGPSGDDIIYAFANDNTCGQTTTDKGCIVRCVGPSCTTGSPQWLPITAPEVIIKNMQTGGGGLTFYLRGSTLGSAGDNTQPNVVISVTGYIKLEVATSTFNIQTSATQRLYDR